VIGEAAPVPEQRLAFGRYALLGAMVTIAPLATSLYLPGLPDIAASLHSSAPQVQLTVSSALVGLGLGQLVLGTVSDRWGRRRPVLGGFAAFVVASLLCALAPNLGALVALRFVQGFAGAVGPAVARACVRDVVDGALAAQALSRLMVATAVAPVIAPLIGGQVLRFTDWRGLFVALAVLGAGVLVAAWVKLPESLPPDRRIRGSSLELVATARRLLSDRTFVRWLTVVALFGISTFSWLSTSSFFFTSRYALSPQAYSYVVALAGGAFFVGAVINARMVMAIGPRRALVRGTTVMAGAATLLVITAVSGAPVGWVVVGPVVLMGAYGGMIANAQALALTPHGDAAGTASALLGMTQFLAGAIVPPLATAALGPTWSMSAAMLLCAIGALLIAVRAPRHDDPARD
jgi:DHA1 family bicyclomycin/chloramphenicol resistance-like MFS transporter